MGTPSTITSSAKPTSIVSKTSSTENKKSMKQKTTAQPSSSTAKPTSTSTKRTSKKKETVENLKAESNATNATIGGAGYENSSSFKMPATFLFAVLISALVFLQN